MAINQELESVLAYLDRVQSQGDDEIKHSRKTLVIKVTQQLHPQCDQLLVKLASSCSSNEPQM